MNSREYWRKRELENLRKNLKAEEEYRKTINGYYDYMLDQIQKEINGFYTKYAKKEGITIAEAKKRVSKLDMEAYERKAGRYVKDKNFSKEANEEMRLYNATMRINRMEMLKANIGLELVDGYDGLQKYFDKTLTERTLSEFERQAGILGNTIHNNQQAAHAIVNSSFSNATYSDRIWMYQDMMKAELSKILQQGLIQGQNPRKLATHLQKLFGVSKDNAERLMRTELARVQTEAQKQSFERNGFSQYVFLALGNACPDCKTLDNGKPIDIKKMMPGENAPPIHPNCRCSVAAYEDNDDYEAWLDFLDKGGTTEEWNLLKKSSAAKSIDGLKEVYYKEQNSYDIKLTEYDKRINAGLSMAAKNVAKYGGKDRCEHMYLVNLKTGGLDYYETNGEPDSVGERELWKYIKAHPNENFAFVHNHNVSSGFSEPDMTTLLKTNNISVMIAVRNDGVIYVAERKGNILKGVWFDELYEKELKELNELSRNGKITAEERSLRRETIIVECLLRDYTKGLIEIDGRK